MKHLGIEAFHGENQGIPVINKARVYTATVVEQNGLIASRCCARSRTWGVKYYLQAACDNNNSWNMMLSSSPGVLQWHNLDRDEDEDGLVSASYQ